MADAKGNPGKRPVRAAPDLGPPGAIKPPAKLTPAAQAMWREIAGELERMNFIRASDRQALARYCQDLAEFWKVSEVLRREDVVYWTETPHGRMKRINPLFAVQDRLARRLESMEDRFGLTPASRQQILLRLASAQPQLPLHLNPAHADEPAPPPPASPLGFLGSQRLN